MVGLERCDHLVAEAGSLGAEHEDVVGDELDIVVSACGSRRESEPTSRQRCPSTGDVAVHRHGRVLVIVEPAPTQLGVVEGEAERFDEMQVDAGVRAQPDDVAGVGGDLGLDEHDVHAPNVAMTGRYRSGMSDETPDTLNDVGVLKRREIEARIVAPLLERLAERFGDEVYDVAGQVIVDVAREQGAALADHVGDDTLPAFARGLGAWSADGALESEVRALTDQVFAFDVTRCRYAEMYRALGLEDLGATLSCNRDGSLIDGFNPNVRFTRTQTIMSGADHCDFRFELGETPVEIDR